MKKAVHVGITKFAQFRVPRPFDRRSLGCTPSWTYAPSDGIKI